MRDGLPVAGISVAGGDWQDQVALHLLLLQHLVEGSIRRSEATAAPRYGTRHLDRVISGSHPRQLGNLTLDPTASAPLVAESLAGSRDI